MEDHFKNNPALADDQLNDLLEDIEIRCSADLAGARGMTAVRRKIAVEVRYGNVSDRVALLATGETNELKTQRVSCMTDRPVMVGSVFQISFDRQALDIAPVLAVCDRCTMLGDTSFETRFKFVNEIALVPDTDQ